MNVIHEEKQYKVGYMTQENGRYAVQVLSPTDEIVKRFWVGLEKEAIAESKLLQNDIRNIIARHQNA